MYDNVGMTDICHGRYSINTTKSADVCFVALRSKSTAMVMVGRSVHLTELFLGKLEQAVNQYFVTTTLLE